MKSCDDDVVMCGKQSDMNVSIKDMQVFCSWIHVYDSSLLSSVFIKRQRHDKVATRMFWKNLCVF